MNITDYEKIFPTAELDGIRFHIPNSACQWRVETLLTKEPDTIAWIRAMSPGDVFFDVGANMGQYSLIAAKQGLTVHAFEPDSQNFALLCRNVAMNGELGARVTAWPLAFGANECAPFTHFHVTGLQYGSSCHALGEPVGYDGKPKQFRFKHGVVAASLSEFVREISVTPTHIKIDVDGTEPNVVDGIGGLLSSVQSVLIEINTHLAAHNALFGVMKRAGFVYDEAQATASRRTDGPFEGVGNCIWSRPA